MEKKFFVWTSRLYDFFFGLLLLVKYNLWTHRNLHKEKELKKLYVRVMNELKICGVELPTKFVIDKHFGLTALHIEETDTVSIPLAYMNKKFLPHGESTINYIRHEFGHACLHHYYLNFGLSEFNDLFGNAHHPYEEPLFICWGSRPFHWKNYITKYAQVHPWEDFAECFLVYFKKKKKIGYLKKNRPQVYEKMLFVKKVLHGLSGIDFTDLIDPPE